MNFLMPLLAYQKRAANKLMRSRVGALYMEMGTGKTRVAFELVKRRLEAIDRVVWVCPVSLIRNTIDELVKHVEDPCVYVQDRPKIKGSGISWYIFGAESLGSSSRIRALFESIVTETAYVIVDEATMIKGHNAKRTRAITQVGRESRYRLILTGTPLTQGIKDLFAQMYFLSPQILGYQSFFSFAANHLEYCTYNPRRIIRAHNVPYLVAKMEPYVFQITKAECLDLPDKTYQVRYVECTGEQRRLYKQVKDEWYEENWQKLPEDMKILQLFSRLQQVACGFLNRDAERIEVAHRRHEVLGSVIDGIGAQKVIVWGKFHYDIDGICDTLKAKGLSFARMDGRMNPTERQESIDRFRGDTQILVMTQGTGGMGLTLNEASYVIYYSNTFKYSDRIQSEDRCHRIGQTKKVTYVDIVCDGTIDERIRACLGEKKGLLEDFREKLKTVKTAKGLKGLLKKL